MESTVCVTFTFIINILPSVDGAIGVLVKGGPVSKFKPYN